MNAYDSYLQEIAERAETGLHPKPIDGAELVSEIVAIINEPSNPRREQAFEFLTYNTLPGTTGAAGVKAKFLKQIITDEVTVPEITTTSAVSYTHLTLPTIE